MTPRPALHGAMCANHGGMAAVEVCTRCGSFLCGDCVEYGKDETPYCAKCAAVVSRRPSGKARASLVITTLGVLGLVVGVLVRSRVGLIIWAVAAPLGFVGLAMAIQEIRAIERNESPAAGRRWAGVARVAGFVHLLLVVLLVASFVAFVVLAARRGAGD